MRIVDPDFRLNFSGPGLCERCHRGQAHRDPHHAFVKRGMGGGTILDIEENLIALCRGCHTKAENCSIEASMCRQIITLRMFPPWNGLTVLPSDIRSWLDHVLRTPKEKPMPERPWVLNPDVFRRGLGS